MSARQTPKRMQAADSPAPGKSWKQILSRPGLLCLLLGLTTLAVYWPAGWNGFVDYDDADYVTANSHVQNGLTWETVVWAFTTGHASNWHPLTWLSHALDCGSSASNPARITWSASLFTLPTLCSCFLSSGG